MRTQRFQQVFTRVRSSFTGFTPGQRAVTVIAIVVAIIGGIVFFNYVSRPAMAPLYAQPLSQSDASAVMQSLNGRGVRTELNAEGTVIQVPRDQAPRLRLDLAAEGLPASINQQDGYALVENAPMTTSDAQQRVLIKRATEGELKKSIETIEAVQSANVQLALPEPDVFVRDQAPTTAAVMIQPRPNQALTGGQVEAITHLVSSSVPKLSPNNVTVTDSTGKLLSAQGISGSGMSEQRVAQQGAYQSGISSQIQGLLDKTVGPGNSTVAVRADLDFSNTKEWTNEYIQPQAGAPPLQTDTTRELYNGTGQTPVGGVLGPDNIPVPNVNAGASNSEYEKTGEKSINPYGTRQSYRDGTAGQVQRLNVSVLLDSRTTGATPLGPIQAAVCGAAGINAERGDVCSVAKIPFDTAAAQAAAASAAEAEAQARQDELIQLAKNIGLGLLLLLALLIGFRTNRKRTRTVEIGELQSVDGPMLPELPGAPGAAAIEAGPSGHPAEFELDSDDALRVLEATPVDPQSQARVEARAEISKLVEENPDEVARLLRGWITERS